MRGNSWLSENRLVSQEGTCSMEWVSILCHESPCYKPTPPPSIKHQTIAPYKHLTGKQKTIPNNILKWQQIMVTQMHAYDPSPCKYTNRILGSTIRNHHVVATSPLCNVTWFEQALGSLAHECACYFTHCRGKYGECHDYVDNYLTWNSRMQARPRLHTLIVSNSHVYLKDTPQKMWSTTTDLAYYKVN